MPSRRPAPPPQPADPRATWAIVLGIAGLVVLLFSAGFAFALSLPCSIAAWVLALRARERDGRAIAALWLGRLGVVAGVAAAVVLLALLASGVDLQELRDDLERELEERQDR